MTFTMRVRNGGRSQATNVQVTDTLPAGLTLVSAPGCSQAGATLTCTLGTMDSGDEATVTVVATVTATGAGVVSAANTATVTTDTTDPDPTNDTSTATVDVPPTADLTITKAAAPDPLDTTLPATYTLTAHNDGPQTAANAVIVDQLPPGFVFTSASAGCTFSAADDTVTCTVGDIASGADASVTITGTLQGSAAGTFVSNSARIGSDTGDPDPVDNTATNTTLAIPAADVELFKFADNPTPNPGVDVTFTLQVVNHGPSVAQNAQVTDSLPAGLTLVSAPRCSQAGATLTCAAGSLASGESQSFPVTVRVGASLTGQDVTNSATATSDTPDPIGPNGTDTSTIAVGQPTPPAPSTQSPPPPSPPNAADLVIAKRALGRAVVGQQLRYAITVANRGPATATGATVADNLSRHLRLVSARPSQGHCTGSREIRCSLGDLRAGAQATITLTVTPRDMGAVNNTARVSSATPDPNGANNVARARVNVGPATSLGVRKTADRRSVRAGDTVGYRITVRTSGRKTARAVRVCDRPPPGLAFVKTAGAELRGGQVCWTIRSLRRGKSRTFGVTARATGRSSPRTLTNRVRVSAANARSRSGRAAVRVLPNEVRPGGVTG